MGGHAAGEVASQEAIDTVHGMVKRGKKSLGLEGPLTEERSRAAARLLEGAVQAATYIVYAMAEIDRGKAGMGTTITAMMRFGSALVTAQVGDSRIYRVRGDDAVQLTEDHTLINWQLKQGIITPEEARVSKQRNVITRCRRQPRLCPSRYDGFRARARGRLPDLQRRASTVTSALTRSPPSSRKAGTFP